MFCKLAIQIEYCDLWDNHPLNILADSLRHKTLY